jgi:plasmid rolling circle replication initiator protein Rep
MHNSISKITQIKRTQKSIQHFFNFDPKLFYRICYCSNQLSESIYEHQTTLERKSLFDSPIRCQLRFCPLCNYFRVKNLTPAIVRELKTLQPDYKFIFITITVPNCKFLNLRQTILKMNKAFSFMTYATWFKKAFKHWIRTTEITFKQNEAHPHFHCIMAVDKNYFKKTNKHYVTTETLQKRFSSLYGVDLCICDIRVIKGKQTATGLKDALMSGIVELSKYVIKSSDLKKLSKANFEIIYYQLVKLRFIATSRTLKLTEDKKDIIDESLWLLIEKIYYRWIKDTQSYKQGDVEKF